MGFDEGTISTVHALVLSGAVIIMSGTGTRKVHGLFYRAIHMQVIAVAFRSFVIIGQAEVDHTPQLGVLWYLGA